MEERAGTLCPSLLTDPPALCGQDMVGITVKLRFMLYLFLVRHYLTEISLISQCLHQHFSLWSRL